MARLIHLSDLHFGAHETKLVAAVEPQVDDYKPDLVVISGDFTQRARTAQFEEACAFLGRLRDAGHEVLAVPGNHDIPLYDVLRRFLSPLTRYRKYIDDSLCPVHELPTAVVLGVNTARSATFKDGKINDEQIAFIRETFERVDAKLPRILVTHHPIFALPTGDGVGEPVKNQEKVLEMIGSLGVDLLLAGHNHRASHQDSADFVTKSTGALVIQAGHRHLAPRARRAAELQQDRSSTAIWSKSRSSAGTTPSSATATRPGSRARTGAGSSWATMASNAFRPRPRNPSRPAPTCPRSNPAAKPAAMTLPTGFDLDEFVTRTLAEDLGEGGDVTSAATIPEHARFTAEMNCREPIVVAGIAIAEAFFRRLDPAVET